MRNEGSHRRAPARARTWETASVPTPSTAFRRRAWLQFQRAIDPLAPPKPLKIERH